MQKVYQVVGGVITEHELIKDTAKTFLVKSSGTGASTFEQRIPKEHEFYSRNSCHTRAYDTAKATLSHSEAVEFALWQMQGVADKYKAGYESALKIEADLLALKA